MKCILKMNAKIQPEMPMLLFKKYPSGGIVSPFAAVLTFTCLKKTHFKNHQMFTCLHLPCKWNGQTGPNEVIHIECVKCSSNSADEGVRIFRNATEQHGYEPQLTNWGSYGVNFLDAKDKSFGKSVVEPKRIGRSHNQSQGWKSDLEVGAGEYLITHPFW